MPLDLVQLIFRRAVSLTRIFLIISGWKPKYAFSVRGPGVGQIKRCPLCRGTIPPSREEISNIRMIKSLMKNTAHPNYAECAERVKRIEAKYGEDWEDTIIEYSSGLVSLPKYVALDERVLYPSKGAT